MASDFSITWQFAQREQLFFFFITDQTPRPNLSKFVHNKFLCAADSSLPRPAGRVGTAPARVLASHRQPAAVRPQRPPRHRPAGLDRQVSLLQVSLSVENFPDIHIWFNG
jgi:hypothetical protein